jgi:hypothetical protein
VALFISGEAMEHRRNYWAIQRKIDGALLPLPPIIGGRIKAFSHTSFGNGGMPRLFPSEESARAALTAYCIGKWGTSDGMPEPIAGTERNKSDYQIVMVQLRY